MTADEPIGKILDDRYRIVAEIGVGGMGTVYEAEHLRLGRRVAIKTLRDEFKGDAGLRARFIAEARAMAEIRHEHIVSVIDIGTAPNGALYFVMEHLDGEDLADTLARERQMAWSRVQMIGQQLCQALSACHAKKVIHRDLKPSNCFMVNRVDGGDYVKILDFGIAKMLAADGRRVTDPQGMHRVDSRRWQHTVTGEVFGTMAYMSPEHFFGQAVDHRTDIYALGVILYEMLTGRTPLADDNIGNFAEELKYLDPSPPSRVVPEAGIPADVDFLVLRALAKRPEERFKSMTEFALALASVQADAPMVRRGEEELASSTLVWSKPHAQAELARMLDREAAPRRRGRGRWWVAGAVGGAVGLAIAGAVVAGRGEPESVAAPRVASPVVMLEPVVTAPVVRLVAPPAGVMRAIRTNEPAVRAAGPRCPQLTSAEWGKVFAPIAGKVEHCKLQEAVKTTIPVPLTIAASGGYVTARPLPQQTGKILGAARCIRKYMGGRIKLPAKLLGCRLAPMLQFF